MRLAAASAKLSSVSLSGFGSQATALEERAMDRTIKRAERRTGVAMSRASFSWLRRLGGGLFRRALFGRSLFGGVEGFRLAGLAKGVGRRESPEGRLRFASHPVGKLFLVSGLPQVVGRLVAQPGQRRAPAGLLQSERHVGGNSVTAIDELGHGLTGHAETQGGFGHRKLEGLETILADDFARMGRVEHLHNGSLLSDNLPDRRWWRLRPR